jgi:hypothetical protein
MIELVILLIVIGALLYLAQRLPIDATMKTIINVVVIVAVAVYALRHLGQLGLG